MPGVDSATPQLSSLMEYREMREEAVANQTLRRVNNIDVVSPNDSQSLGLCHVVDLNRHSMTLPQVGLVALPFKYPLEATAALALAYEHLNTGNGIVVKEVEGLNQRCNIRFTTEFIDTQGREGAALDGVIDVIGRNATTSRDPLPCAFTGAMRSSVSIATAALTGHKGYPQLGGLSTTSKLDDKETFPLFGRVIPAGSGFGPAAMDFLYNHMNIRHLGVIFVNDVIGLSFVDGFLQAAEGYDDFFVSSYSYATEGLDERNADDRSIPIAVQMLAKTGYRNFLAIVDNGHSVEILEQAVREKIAGTNVHNWFTSNIGVVTNLIGAEFDETSALHNAIVGMTTISIPGSLPGVGRYDQFYSAWSALGQDNETLGYLQSLIPSYPEESGYDASFTPETFADIIAYSPLLYDTAIAIGLGACAVGKIDLMDGNAHYETILNTTFVGASGRVAFDPMTGSRSAASAVLAAQNLVVEEVDDGENTTKKFVNRLIGHYSDGVWTQSLPVTFNDGTKNFPLDLPELHFDYHHIGPLLRSAGMIMASIVVLCSVACLVWTGYKAKSRVVRASQPFFLRLICFGTTLMGLSIIALGIDNQVSNDFGCSIACMAFPWLISLGWVFVFSALFTKTHRVNKVFHQPNFSRVAVSISDVVKPMTFLLAALSPLVWKRTVIDVDMFGREIASQGSCTSDNLLPYLVVLGIVDLGTIVVAAYEAYNARNISTEFAESENIGRAIGVILVVAFLGVPIIYIAGEDNQAYYFVMSGVVFVISMTTLSLIYLPKILFKQDNTQTENIRKFFRSRESFDTTGTVLGSDHFIGAKVLEHPKLRENLMERNRQLKDQIELLEGIFVDCTDPGEIFDRYTKFCAKNRTSGVERAPSSP